MKKILTTASIITSGIIVGALVRKFAQKGFSFSKTSALDSIKSVKDGIKSSIAQDDMNEFFV